MAQMSDVVGCAAKRLRKLFGGWEEKRFRVLAVPNDLISSRRVKSDLH